ncbi:MAG: SulP family inorganic anion transporter [Thermoguttaceae bacterium]
MFRTLFRQIHNNFRPQLFSVLKEGYSLQKFSGDLIAGIITGIVALPLAIAFGIASGVTPEQGLYTAIIAGFLISFFSGSRVQIGGPTGAFIIIVYGIVQTQGIQGLLVATILAGLLLILMGLSGLGKLIKYIPYPVILGFTSGIAVCIAMSQVQPFLGLNLGGETVPPDFLHKIILFSGFLGTINLWSVGLAVLTLLIITCTPRISKRIPGSLIAVLVCTLLVTFLNIPVDTIGQKVGEEAMSLQMSFPAFGVPQIDWSHFRDLFRAAIAIAILGAIESLLSAVVADGMTGMRHRSNTELVAQGIANVITPFFGGIPATGAIARTATNVKNGGRTPIAGLIHAVVLLGIVLCLGRYAAMIPLCTLAGILMVVSFNMSEHLHFRRMFNAPKSDLSIMLITFFLTVLLDLTTAIPVGLILASFLFMRHMEQMFRTGTVDHKLHSLFEDDPHEDPLALRLFDVPDGVHIIEINGPFFFGAVSKFNAVFDADIPRVLILRMKNVPVIDATGLHSLEEIVERAERIGAKVLITGIQQQPFCVLKRYGLLEKIGTGHLHPTIVDALPHAAEIIEEEIRVRKQQLAA